MTRHSEKSGHPSWASSLDNLSDSIPSPDRLQHSVIFYCSVMVLVTMSATIASLASVSYTHLTLPTTPYV